MIDSKNYLIMQLTILLLKHILYYYFFKLLMKI